jgi:hypothetical protein
MRALQPDRRIPLPPQLGPARRWRRIERSVVRDHIARVEEQLDALVGLTLAASTTRPGGFVSFDLPGWTITMAGVAPRCAPVGASPRARWTLAGAGRYGRFWWVTMSAGASRHTVLGSHLRLVRTRGGPLSGASPERFGSLTPA